MSKTNPKLTASGHARTESDRHPYLRVSFWAKPENWFWENEFHTPAAKEYFRGKISKLLSNRHNQMKIQNSQA